MHSRIATSSVLPTVCAQGLALAAAAASFAVCSRAQESSDSARDHAPPAVIELFDGESLDGWVTKGGRYDGKAIWGIEDGAITGRVGNGKAGGLIYTEQRWHSFDLWYDTKIDWPFDSGIFIRMAPAAKGAQVTLDWRPNGEIAGIYSEGWLKHNPEGAAMFRKGEWNTGRVRVTGRDFRVQAWINDQAAMDYQLPYGSDGYVDTGLIGLQVHGGLEPDKYAARFRGLRLRELPVFDTREFTCDDDGFLEPVAESGWQNLLDAKLSKWEAAGAGDKPSGFDCDGRVLALRSEGAAHHLATREDFGDFELRLDFRILRHANSGVFLRANRAGGNPAYSGAEIQILDDFNWEKDTNSKLKPWQFTGSLYGSVPAAHPGTLYPLGRWNSYSIRCQGKRMSCELNGVVLWDVDTHDLKPEQGKPFQERVAAGFLGLQRHAPAGAVEGSTYAWFRNVFVRPLSK